MSHEVELHSQLRGRFRLRTRHAKSGNLRLDTGWFDNLILDSGLERMGVGAYATACQVGAGTASPNPGDTTLSAYVAGTASVVSTNGGVQTSPPYFGWTRRLFRFGAGEAAGTLGEVGVGWAAATGNLFSKARILDTNGNPTTITVLSDEFLEVLYELRLYPNLLDKVFTANIGGVDHLCVLRAAAVNSDVTWQPQPTGSVGQRTLTARTSVIYSGDIGPITGSPSGVSQSTPTSQVNDLAYAPGSKERRGTSYWGLDNGNLSGGIRAFVFRYHSGGMWQMSFDPPIDKDNTKTMTLTYKVAWGRYSP